MRYKASSRRKIDGYGLATPDQSLDLRTVFTRIGEGRAINARLKTHQPIPADGEDLDDFDSGVREIIDPTDMLQLVEDVKARKAAIQKEADKRIKQRNSIIPPEQSEETKK